MMLPTEAAITTRRSSFMGTLGARIGAFLPAAWRVHCSMSVSASSGLRRANLLPPPGIGPRSPQQPNEVLLPRWWKRYIRCQLQFEADEMAEPCLGSARQHQSIGEEYGIPIAENLAG